MMREPIEMNRHIGNGTSVIGQQAIAQLLTAYLFEKKLIRIRKANYQQPCLIDNRVARLFLNVILEMDFFLKIKSYFGDEKLPKV